MRVTAQVKEQTRDKILRVARSLFSSKGFEETTTRDIARRATIAAGTLFNYFAGKEALGMTLLAQSLDSAREDFELHRRGDESLDELLFAHVMSGLRALAPHRPYVAAVLESAMSPFTTPGGNTQADHARTQHLETVAELLHGHDSVNTPSFVAMHLYWTLYLGVLAFWSGDESPNQEDTLVVLDQSLQLFVQSLSYNSRTKEVADGT